MYQQLTLTPIGFPLLDDLCLALLTQQRCNIWRSSVCDAVCAFVNKKLAGRKETFKASPENIKYFHVDCYGKAIVHYDGGTFDLVFTATKTRRGVVLEVIGVAHTNPFVIGIVATVGERAIYEEMKK